MMSDDDDDATQQDQSMDTLSMQEFVFPDLDETRQYLGDRYQNNIENLQQCIDHITSTFVQGNQTASLVGAVAAMFRVSIENNGQISHPDIDFGNLLNEEGDFDSNVRLYGPEAAFRAKPYFHKELIRLMMSYEQHGGLNQLGTERYPVSKLFVRATPEIPEDTHRMHRLLLLSDAAMHFLVSYSVLASAINDDCYHQSKNRYDQTILQYEGKLTTEMIIKPSDYNPALKLELYITRLLWIQGYKIQSNIVYKPVLRSRTKRVACQTKHGDWAYMCSICGRPEQDHGYCEEVKDRKKHCFHPILVPMVDDAGHVMLSDTKTYEPLMPLEQFIYEYAGRTHNSFMYALTRSSQNIVSHVCTNIQKAPETEVPRLKKVQVWSFEDGILDIQSGKFYPWECHCHSWDPNQMIHDDAYCIPIPGEVDDNWDYPHPALGQRRQNGSYTNVPSSCPNDNRATHCTRCGAGCQPMEGVYAMKYFPKKYMNYPRILNDMRGDDFSEAYKEDLAQWSRAMISNIDVGDAHGVLQQAGFDNDNPDTFVEDCIDANVELVADEITVYIEGQNDAGKEIFSQPSLTTNFSASAFACRACGNFCDHPCHAAVCPNFTPSKDNFSICMVCGNGPDHAIHQPECRLCLSTPLYKNLLYNTQETCNRCGKDYDTCTCPRGFYPFTYASGAEHNINCSWWDSIMEFQEIPSNGINFVYEMVAKTLLGKNQHYDKMQSMNFIYGPPGNGKSTLIDAIEGIFNSVDIGFMSDNAQEQFGWEQCVDRITNELKYVILCKEVSLRFRIPMTELQLACDGKEFTVIRKGKEPLVVRFDAQMWFVGNEIPFYGAMLRRLIAIHFPNVVPKNGRDGTLLQRMEQQYPQVMFRAATGWRRTRNKCGKNVVLDRILPMCFKKNVETIQSTKEPMHSFLENIGTCTGSKPWEIPPVNDPYRTTNFVSLQKFNQHFVAFCRRHPEHKKHPSAKPFDSSEPSHYQAFKRFDLKTKVERRLWDNGDANPQQTRQTYIVGIRDPSQMTQEPMRSGDYQDEDEETDQHYLNIRRALNVNGVNIETIVDDSFSQLRTTGSLRIKDFHHIYTHWVSTESNLEDDNVRLHTLDLVRAMMRDFGLEKAVLQELRQTDRPRKQARR